MINIPCATKYLNIQIVIVFLPLYLIVIIEIKFQNDSEGDTYVADAAVVGVSSIELGIHRYLMVAGAGAVQVALLLCFVRTLNILIDNLY